MTYESERGDPSTDQCAIGDARGYVTLLFDGFYLKLLKDGKVDAAWHARSGIPNGDWFDYTPDRQKQKDEGPIPAGEYWIQPDQIATPSVGRDSWGNFRITIHYFPATYTFNRGGFFIHGGKTFGSKGCIDLAQYMDAFVQKIKTYFFGKVEVPDRDGGGLIPGYSSCYIPLTVKYAADKVAMPTGSGQQYQTTI